MLMTLGVDPAAGDSPAGQMVAGALLEGKVRTNTRPRRAL
jgi:hypothetical protein